MSFSNTFDLNLPPRSDEKPSKQAYQQSSEEENNVHVQKKSTTLFDLNQGIFLHIFACLGIYSS